MKKLVMATVAVLIQGIAFPAHAAREIDCMVMWDRADLNKNGILEGKRRLPTWTPSERASRSME